MMRIGFDYIYLVVDDYFWLVYFEVFFDEKGLICVVFFECVIGYFVWYGIVCIE